jgi:aspartokinase
VETVAVYQEERVKVYGISRKVDLALVIISFPIHRVHLWGRRIMDFNLFIKRFELVTYHASDKNRTELHLVFDCENSSKLGDTLGDLTKDEQETDFAFQQPVEILYLFGPHFQDRFGIADIAVHALTTNKTDILISGCSGTSMYFVTPNNQSKDGLKTLTDTFVIPTTV